MHSHEFASHPVGMISFRYDGEMNRDLLLLLLSPCIHFILVVWCRKQNVSIDLY